VYGVGARRQRQRFQRFPVSQHLCHQRFPREKAENGSQTHGSSPQSRLNVPNISSRDPTLRHQSFSPLIPLPHIQSRKYDFLFPNDRPPSSDRFGKLEKFGSSSLVRRVEYRVKIFES